jgi:hypothetical protein
MNLQVSIKCGEFSDWLRNGWFLRKEPVSWNKLSKLARNG